MIRHLSILLLLLLFLTNPLHAHRLNEYLQATRIALSKDSVSLYIDLTAGTEIAQNVLQQVDRNADGVLSVPERQAYIDRFVRGLSVLIDGVAIPLRIESWMFPGVDAIRNGTGGIQLHLVAPVISAGKTHQLLFKNERDGSAVYLVNCLQPLDTAIRITAQSRNSDQSEYRLDYTTEKLLYAGQNDHKIGTGAVLRSFFLHGVRHILTGYDHLLFLCALLLGVTSLWQLVKIVTAFTIAHSITLTLAALGLIHVPSYITEPIIAASIICVALQNIFRPAASGGGLRIAVVMLFGLFHGLGFAGGLIELMHSQPRDVLVYALIGFSVGVEAGNQLVLLPLWGLQQAAKRVRIHNFRQNQPGILGHFASGIIAAAGLYYLVIALS